MKPSASGAGNVGRREQDDAMTPYCAIRLHHASVLRTSLSSICCAHKMARCNFSALIGTETDQAAHWIGRALQDGPVQFAGGDGVRA